MRISDWSSDVCSSDLIAGAARGLFGFRAKPERWNSDRTAPAEVRADDDCALPLHIINQAADTAGRARAIGAAQRIVVGAGLPLDRGARAPDEGGEPVVGQRRGGIEQVPPARLRPEERRVGKEAART